MIPVDIDNFNIIGIVGAKAFKTCDCITIKREVKWVPFNLNKIES